MDEILKVAFFSICLKGQFRKIRGGGGGWEVFKNVQYGTRVKRGNNTFYLFRHNFFYLCVSWSGNVMVPFCLLFGE